MSAGAGTGSARTGCWLPAAVATLAVALALAVYLPALSGPFVSDDIEQIQENPLLQRVPLARFWELFTTRTTPMEHLPLRDLSYRIDLALWGLDPFGFHLTNLVLYALVCAATWLATRALLDLLRPGEAAQRAAWLATAATALFAAHPAHVEAVAWVSGRKDLLAGLFGLLALQAFARALRPASPSRAGLAAATLAYGAAVLSKPTALPLALVLLLLAAVRLRRRGGGPRLALLLALPPLVVAALGFGLHMSAGAESGTRGSEVELGLGDTALRALHVLGGHLYPALAPLRPRLTYAYDASGLAAVVAPLAGLLVALAALDGLRRTLRDGSLRGFGIAFFALLMVPFAQLIPYRTWSLVSERFLFLPVLGILLALIDVASARGRRTLAIACASLFVAGVGLTAQRARDWTSVERLYAANLEAAPGYHYAAYLMLNDVLLPAERYAEARRVALGVSDARAREDLLAFVDTQESAQAFVRGGSAVEFGRRAQALQGRLVDSLAAANPQETPRHVEIRRIEETLYRYYSALLAASPGNAALQFNMGILLGRLGLHELAIEQLEAASRARTLPPEARARVLLRLGTELLEADREADAERAFREAAQRNPRDWRAAWHLAQLLGRRGPAAERALWLDRFRERAAAAGVGAAEIDELVRQLERGGG